MILIICMDTTSDPSSHQPSSATSVKRITFKNRYFHCHDFQDINNRYIRQQTLQPTRLHFFRVLFHIRLHSPLSAVSYVCTFQL
jgi:hypothetical protein